MKRGKQALPKVGPNGGSILAFARTPFAIDRLLELGAPREQRDRWGASPIEAISRLGARGAPLVAHLLQRGVQAQPQEYARIGDQQHLAELIDAQPELVRDDAVVMGAVDFGHHALVSWSLERGASVSARSVNASHCTALHSAAWNGDVQMVQLLVAAGASITAIDDEHQNTARGWAEISVRVTNNPRCAEVAQYLRACEMELGGEPATTE